jgi:hypothetical protein
MSLASVSRMEAKLLLPTYERQHILLLADAALHKYAEFPQECAHKKDKSASPQY